MSHIEIQNVQKFYDSVQVLPPLSLEVAEGEFLVLVGPSGCGKSTLLRMVAGLEDISAGEILLSGRVVNDETPFERDVAMVFQNYALYPHMTVRKNMGFSLRLSGLNRADVQERVSWAAALLGLEELLDRYPRQLSGGQRQRVAMGRAIVRKPSIFLFDEPLSNLDAKLRVQMRNEIRKMHRLTRTTTIYVTHDQVEAMTLADRVVVMRAGKIEQVGRPIDLYDRPETAFVAGFIGSPPMNMFDATAKSGGLVLQDGTVWPMQASATDTLALTAGVRPEHLEVSNSGGGLRATVVALEPTGADTLILANTAFGAEVQISLRERVSLEPGETVVLTPSQGAVHVFERETGLRLSDGRNRSDAGPVLHASTEA